MALLSDPDFLKASTNARGNVVVRFRYDPSSINQIHVNLPHARGQDTMHLRVPVERRAQDYARGLSVWAHASILRMIRDTAMATVDLAALDAAKAKLLADLDRDMPGSAKMRGMTRIARIRQIGGVAPYGDSVRTTPEGSFEDRRQQNALEAAGMSGSGAQPPTAIANDYLLPPSEFDPNEDDLGEFANETSRTSPRQTKYARSSDPATSPVQRRPKAGGRGRATTPATAIPAADDEIDFYSDEVKA